MKTIRTKKKTAHRLCPPNGLRYFCSIMKKILLLIALIITAAAVRAESIDTLFHRTPERVLPLLDGNTRLDLLDLYNHKMEAKAENIFGGMAKLTRKTSDYAHVVLTNVSEWEMKLQSFKQTLDFHEQNVNLISFAIISYDFAFDTIYILLMEI